jgi:DNA-binding response OmpR family regulator
MDNHENPTVLVIDDDQPTLDLMVKILSKSGYRVLTAGTATAGRDILAEQPIDMLLCDVDLPDLNGFELMKEVKRQSPQVAVVMMTGFADTFTIKDALVAGADEYITKPFKQYEVTAVVQRALWRMQAPTERTEVP